MKWFMLLLLFGSGCMFQNPCKDKLTFFESINILNGDAERNRLEKDEENWNELDEKLNHLVEQCYPNLKPTMNVSERIEFFKGVLAYTEFRDNSNHSFKKIMIRGEIDLGLEMEELGAEGRKELEAYFREEFLPELGKVVDEILDGIDSFGQELKDALEEMTKEK